MNEILVAVDFSDSSLNALEHAVGVASKFKSNVLMVWIETKAALNFLGVKKSDQAQKEVSKRFDELVTLYKPTLGDKDIEYTLRKGVIYKEIVALSKENDVDLIVTGVHGVHGFRRFFMGDNANHIVAEASCPVLTIGLHRTTSRALQIIVLPVDSSLDTRQKVGLATRFAQLFGATIHILGMYGSSVKTLRMRVDDYVGQVDRHFKKAGINTVIHFTKSDKGARTILNYSKKVDANLILTMIETESQTSDIWLGSQGQQLVNQSPIPVMSIANRQLIKSRPGL